MSTFTWNVILYLYRETCKTIATENEKLQSTLFQSERDTVEVVTYLKRGDMEKDEKVLYFSPDVVFKKTILSMQRIL